VLGPQFESTARCKGVGIRFGRNSRPIILQACSAVVDRSNQPASILWCLTITDLYVAGAG